MLEFGILQVVSRCQSLSFLAIVSAPESRNGFFVRIFLVFSLSAPTD